MTAMYVYMTDAYVEWVSWKMVSWIHTSTAHAHSKHALF